MSQTDKETDKRTPLRKWSQICQNITMIGQLGLSLIVPVLMCMFACYFINTRLHTGGWVYIPGLILGIGSSGMTAWKFYHSIVKKNENTRQERGPSFNKHI